MKRSIIFLYKLFFYLILLIIVGCRKEWLDQKTDANLVIPSTIKDFDALIANNTIMNYNNPEAGEIASDGHYALSTSVAGLNDQIYTAYTWSKERTFRGVNSWINPYNKIFYCNVVLEGLAKLKPTNSTEQTAISALKGNSLFHRAMAHYQIAQIFAPPYTKDSARFKLGIPLKLESDVNIPTSRPTLDKDYEQIIADLFLAKDLLPLIPTYKTRASKPAAWALLARIYLSMEDYQNAKNAADSCLNLYSSLMNYNKRVASDAFPFPLFNDEVIYHCTLLNSSTLTTSTYLVDQSLYNMFATDDLRKTLFFTVAANGNITFKGSYFGSNNLKFAGLATDEVYLIRAESNIRIGKTDEGLTDLNTLIKTRWKDAVVYPVISASNDEEALRKVLDERRKQLISRGLRWSDLRRLNRDPRFATSITRTDGVKVFTLAPNSYQYTFRIPDDIIEQTKIQQNSGW
jgi:tetratricopeptide (TPR) repeat protein